MICEIRWCCACMIYRFRCLYCLLRHCVIPVRNHRLLRWLLLLRLILLLLLLLLLLLCQQLLL